MPYRGGIPICILIYAEDVDRPAYSVRCLCVSVDSRVVASRISKQEGLGSIPGGGKEV